MERQQIKDNRKKNKYIRNRNRHKMSRQEGKNMTRKKLLGIIAGSVAVVAVAGGILIYHFITSSPLYRLGIGVKNLVEEVKATENPLLMEEGAGRFFTMVGTESASADYSVNLSGNPVLNGMTLGLDGTVERDMTEQKFHMSALASTSQIPLMAVDLYSDQDEVYLQIPEIYEGSVTFQAKDFDGQYNESALKDFIGSTIDEDIDFDFFTDFTGLERGEGSFLDPYGGDVKAFLKDIDLAEEKNYELDEDRRRQIEQAYGEEQKLTSYFLTLTSERLGLQEPLKVRILLNKKNRILMVECAEGMPVSDGYRVSGNVLFLGTETSINSVLTDSRVTEQKENTETHSDIKLSMVFDPETKAVRVSGDGTLDMLEPGMAAQLDVILSDFEPGKQANLDFQNLHLTKKQKEIGKLTGKASLHAMPEDIRIPDGEQYEIFDMNKLELGILLWKWKDNLGGVLGMLFGEEISDRIAEEVGDAVEEKVKNSIGDAVEDKLDGVLGEDISEILGDKAEDILGEKAGEIVGDMTEDKVGELLNPDKAEKERLEKELEDALKKTEGSDL